MFNTISDIFLFKHTILVCDDGTVVLSFSSPYLISVHTKIFMNKMMRYVGFALKRSGEMRR